MSARRVEPSLTEERILRCLDLFGEQYAYDLAKRTKRPYSTVKTLFKKLEAIGYIEIIESAPKKHVVRRYGRITNKGKAWLKGLDKERKE